MRSRSRSGAVLGVAVFVLAGCAGIHAGPDIVEDEPEAEATSLCEVFSGHRHNPDWLWFTQTVSPDERRFVCGIGEVAQGESEASARARIEPYCREMIAKALGGARECYGTRFLLAPSEVRLQGEFVDDEDGGRDYLLRGRVATD